MCRRSAGEYVKKSRALLRAEGLCIYSRHHGKATHGVVCYRCRVVSLNVYRRKAGLEELEVPPMGPISEETTIAEVAARIRIRPVSVLLARIDHSIACAGPFLDDDSMSMRVLRALRRHEWLGRFDLVDTLDAHGLHESDQVSTALGRFLRSGYIERKRVMNRIAHIDNGNWYRLTDAGRRYLDARSRALNTLPVATDAEIAEHDAELAQYGRSAA